MANYLLLDEDLANNPSTRVPVCLCLDLSGSMLTVESGSYNDTGRTETIDGKQYRVVEGGITRIDELQKGVDLFFDAIRKDEMAVDSAEIAIVGFANSAQKLLDFAHVEKQDIPKLVADGSTAMGEGVNMALDMLEARKQQYKSNGVQYFQPWLVIMTDGDDNGSPKEQSKAIERIQKLSDEGKIVVFAVAIGNEANIETLSKFSPKRKPLRLRNLRFSEFFNWLSQSVSRTSVSSPGEKIPLPPIDDWGTL